MGLRDKLEGIKNEKVAQEETKEKETLVSEQEMVKQQEEQFLEAYNSKNTLAEAVHSLREAQGGTRQALGKRKAEFQNITGLMEEIKAEDSEQELPSFKEVVANPEEGSDEERYVQSKEEVALAITELRKQKEALKEIGIDVEGKTDEELELAVKETLAQKAREVREYARQHPKSELPEVQEVRQEMIAAREKELVTEISNSEHTLFGGAINAALSDLERNGWLKDLDGEDSYGRDQLMKRLPRDVMRELEASPEYEKALAALSEDIARKGNQFDSIDAQALGGAIKKLLLNFQEAPFEDDKFGAIDPIRAHSTWENSIQNEKTLRKIYESFPGQSLAEFKYSDGSGYKYEAMPHLATLFDGPDLQKLAQRSLERASIQGRLDNWENDQYSLRRKLEESERDHEKQERQVSQEEQRLKSTQEGLQRLEESENGLQIALQELVLEKALFGENERVNFSNSYNKPVITFEADKEEYNAANEEQTGLVLKAESLVAEAEKALREIPKKGLFEGQKSYDAKREILVNVIREARKAVEEAKMKRGQVLDQKHNEQMVYRTKKVLDIVGRVSLEKYSGTWAGLIGKIETAFAEKITFLRQEKENLDKAREEAERTLQVEREKLGDISKQVAEKKVELEQFDQKNKESLQRDLENIKRGW